MRFRLRTLPHQRRWIIMSARSVSFFLTILIATVVSGQDAKKELDQLQGEWTMFSRESNGQPSMNTRWKLTITGDKWKVTRPDSDEAAAGATIKLDPSKNPKTIDLGNLPGIYKLEDDTLTLCRPAQSMNANRPNEFKSDSSNEIIVWKRVGKK
jgi:uncharacterized protein (TIGR03067 family)